MGDDDDNDDNDDDDDDDDDLLDVLLPQPLLNKTLLVLADYSRTHEHDALVVRLDESSSNKSSKSAKKDVEVLFHIRNTDDIITSPADETVKMYRLPNDFQLVFFGTVGPTSAC